MRFALPVRWLAALLAIVLLAAPAAAQQRLLNYPDVHKPAVSEAGMVASQNETAARVGASILARGGNAVDAAVATAFALAVTLPRAGNIGGDGFMLVHLAEGRKTIAIDFRSVAPLAATEDMFIDADGKERPEASRGYRAAAVPGSVAGLWLAHQRYGRLRWAELVQPAIDLAEKGVVLTRDEAFAFEWARDVLQQSAAGRASFFGPGGRPWAGGERWRQPALAWTLRQIRARGADGFYRGEVARRFAADMAANGGLITEEDLAKYRAVERTPLASTYRGFDVRTSPPASGGGPTVIEALNILETFDLKSLKAGSAAELHLVAEAIKLATADRLAHVGDTDFAQVPLRGLTSKAYAAEQARRIDRARALTREELKPGAPQRYESPSTTHFSTADREGNAVAVTTTLGAEFGSGVALNGLGFLLNNQMNNFSYEAAFEAKRTGAPAPPNGFAPGKRMISTMAPTMVFKDGKPWLVTGSPGGATIPGTIVQMIVDVVDFGLNVAEASHAPRINPTTGGELLVETNANPDTVERLSALGHKIRVGQTIGSTQSILIDGGKFYGGVDPRRPGAYAASAEGIE